MLKHAEYTEKSTKNSISSFHLIEILSTVPVILVLFTNAEISELSMKHGIKETVFNKIHFLHHLSTKTNAELNGVTESMLTINKLKWNEISQFCWCRFCPTFLTRTVGVKA